MKKILTLFNCILLSSAMYAQTYNYSSSTGTSEPYAYNNSGTTVLGIPSVGVLSTAQSIPFAFDFYGLPVTSYKASDNGYITFNTSSTGSYNANTSIPNSSGPNNAIYAFWDDLNIVAGSGSIDEVRSSTYGTSPNRVHVIQWYSVTPASGTGFLYTAIRLYECGDFDIIHNYSNTTGMSASVGCENNSGTIGTMAQGPSFDYPSLTSAASDDVVYSFFWSDVSYDASITSSVLNGFITIGNNTVEGEIKNNGSVDITSYDLNYSVDGGPAVTMNVSGINISASGGTSNFTHSTPLNIANGGEAHTLCIWASNINGNLDERTCNDQLCVETFSANGTGATNIAVVIEEFTGSWCGWCPDGGIIVDEILTAHPGEVIGVSIHDGDDMEFDEGIRTAFNVSAYPNALVDRFVFPGEDDEPHSRSTWEANAVSRLTKYTPVEVSLDLQYDAASRTITATVNADFVDYTSGDIRFNLEITEDNVTGTGSGYDQVNYLNTTAGHPYEGAGDPIIGFNHRHVLRANPSGVYGNAGVIPSTVAPGSHYSETFTYVVPASYDDNELNIIGFVAFANPVVGEREILNATEASLSEASLNESSIFSSFTIAPNPVKGDFTLFLDLRHPISAEIVIYNLNGEKVGNIASGEFNSGKHTILANTGDLMAGIYYITVITESASFTNKLVIR